MAFISRIFYPLYRKQLTVMTREEKPYVMIKEGNFTGNDMFEGFCIDLLKGIAAQVGFQYSIKLVPDNTYGIFNPETKMWNGIGMHVNKKVYICKE